MLLTLTVKEKINQSNNQFMTQPALGTTEEEGFVSHLLREVQLERLLPSLTAGLVAGVLEVLFAISFAALIFAGDLSPFVSAGIGLALFSTMVLTGLVACLSSLRGNVAASQDTPAIILALVAATIAATMPATATPNELFLTILAALGLTTLLTGAFYLALGLFNLGRLIRFIPYPVVGGFTAGTGWLFVLGAITVMTDISPTVANLPTLLGPEMVLRWLPGVGLAILLAVILPRFSHFLTLPGLILAATGLFYLILWTSGGSLAEASAQGWLMGPFPEGGLWQPLRPADLGQVNWAVILGQSGSIATILLISIISLLLNASVIELAVERDIDLNRELRATGIANMVAGLGAGIPGYVGISSTTLGYKIGADSRLVGLTVALFAGIILVVGASALSIAPKVVLGGLLLFMGLEFLIEWVYQAWFKFSRSDYLIIITILLVVMLVGFLEGVIVGIVLAVILFVVTYSRVDVVKHTLSGANSYSKVVRPALYRQLLKERGERLYILELQGFIFFGTANRLLEQVRQRLADSERLAPHFILFDFRQVSGLDASAALSFVKIKQVAEAQHIRLVFTHLSAPIKHQLAREVFSAADETAWRIFPDLDHGLEWCEAQLMQRFDEVGLSPTSRAAKRNLKGLLAQSDKLSTLFDELVPADERHTPPEADLLAALRPYLAQRAVEQGDYLMRQGETPTGLYFIETGQVTVRMETAEGRSVRLRTMGAGTVVGEMGFYLGTPASASVIVTHPGSVFYLSLERLAEIEATAPHLTTAFHKFMVHLQSQRLADANDTLTALLR